MGVTQSDYRADAACRVAVAITGTWGSTMRTTRRLAAGLALAATIISLGALPTAAQIDPPTPIDPGDLEPADGAALTPDGVVDGAKGTSSTLAETDPALLDRTDGEVVEVLIKLDYDAIAVYDGGRDGLAATSPSVTGDPLSGTDVTTGPYARQVARDEAAIVADIRAAVPSAQIGQSLRIVYGGVAARIAARDIEAVLAVDGVVAVQSDAPNQLLTDASPSFVGADDVWANVGGQATAGSGQIFATLDTGVWPEHPSFADTGATATPPPTADGQPWECDFGDNPLTPATDVFSCNDKLIAGRTFMDTYDAEVGDDVYAGLTRDSDGHGTHTASTAAGNAVASAQLLGIERGPLSGMAPGAWVAAYKVCGPAGCYPSDSAAAVQRAILDGVDVINFSISGGGNPATDVVELAFLDAYAAGVFVAASAGNAGPAASTADHLGPWTTTVAATSPNRDFATTLTLTGGAGLTLPGLTISNGISTPAPIVLASAPPYSDALCTSPAPPGIFTGKIVACQRGPGRVLKSFNVRQGGAAGMVLYNATPFNVSAESHWVPTAHIQDGPALVAHLGANPGALASFGPGTKTAVTGDVIAPFSSRGPGGLTIKPDVGAPGQNVLAGHTPTPGDPSGGPPGEYYRIIDGTSMAAPHVAGAALLLRDAHPDWTPGQVRSALTGSASPTVTDGGNPATPFATGSGRIQVDAAVVPGLLLDETAARFASLGTDPASAVHLNLAQVDAPRMPGRLRTTRTVTNPGAEATYTADVTTDLGTITVEPSTFTLDTGESQVVEITIDSDAPVGSQGIGAIVLTAPGRNDTRLPVAFVTSPSEISLTGLGCTPDPVVVPQTSTCSFELANEGGTDALVDLRAEGDTEATVTAANLGATTTGGVASVDDVPIEGYAPGVPHTAPGSSPAGYIPLDVFGGTLVTPVGDEQNVNFNVPSFVYGDRSYDRIGVNSNGYIVVGGTDSAEDMNCCNLTAIGDPGRPNDVLAPFWTDLDGTGRPGTYVNVLTDGSSDWIVVEWRVNVFGTSSQRVFQTWIGVNGSEDITFAYDPANLPGGVSGQPLLVGAENREGAGTTTLAAGTPPTADLRVTTGATTPGGTTQWDVTVQGAAEGTGDIEVEATSNAHPGTVVAVEQLEVDPEPLPVVTDDPDDLTVDALQTATFTAAATGGTLARWEKLPDGSATWETVAGATTTTLSFTAHGGDDGSQYRAVFANTTGGETTTAAADLTVDQLDSTTSVSVSPSSPSRGQDVTFTALVGPSTATGTVQFALDGNPIGSPVTVASGSASSAAVPDIAAGPHSVTATFSGDADHEGSGDTKTFTVVRNGSSTTIVEITSGVIGEDTPVDVTITVVPAPDGGTVQLSVDGTPYGSPLTLDGSGSVETTVTGLTPGSRTILAEFSGDDDLDPSDDDVTITVYAAEEAFVRRAYQVMLGRNGDATGIAYWVGRIEGGMDRTMLIDHFATLTEGRMRLVGRVYLTALDRSSTVEDRTYWAGRVAAGMTAEDLLATLLASAEGVDNAGGTAEGWVEKLYDVHLVRGPSPSELDYWVGRAEATLNIAQVRQLAKQFGRMPEATAVALSEAARLVCGVTTIPSGTADQLRTRWVGNGRHPIRLSGDTLALLCPSSSAPPT